MYYQGHYRFGQFGICTRNRKLQNKFILSVHALNSFRKYKIFISIITGKCYLRFSILNINVMKVLRSTKKYFYLLVISIIPFKRQNFSQYY